MSIRQQKVDLDAGAGNTIPAAFARPEGASGAVPAVLLLGSAESEASGKGVAGGLAGLIGANGVATLRFVAEGPQAVGAALSFLASQSEVDASRVGIVAEGESAGGAVNGWNGDPRVPALVLIAGRLDPAAMECIAESPRTPLRIFVSPSDRAGFADMTDAYFLSTSPETDIDIQQELGDPQLEQIVADWISAQVLATGCASEVSFETADGWTIHANLRVPQSAKVDVPAVILLHTSQTDRSAYHELEVALAKRGMAVLNLDWRGRGQSIGKGTYIELSDEEKSRGYLDVLAGVAFLADQAHVDASRIGVLGAAIGTKNALGAALREPRIRTIAFLTGFYPSEEEAKQVAGYAQPILFVAVRGMPPVAQAMTELYRATRDRGSELWLYDGGGVGYELFERDASLLPRLTGWFAERLAP